MSIFENLRNAARNIVYDPVDRVLREPPLDIPPEDVTPQVVLDLLEHEDHAVRSIGHLANGNTDNAVTQMSRAVIQNNGALSITDIARKTGLNAAQIPDIAHAFSGHFANEKETIIAEALHPIISQTQDIYIGPTNLDKTS